MKIEISSKQLEILRKAVYGLSNEEIASQLMINQKEVDHELKKVLKSARCKEPVQAMQNLAKNGFNISE